MARLCDATPRPTARHRHELAGRQYAGDLGRRGRRADDGARRVFPHPQPEALGSIVAVLVVTAALLAVEHFVETPREAVERTLYELAAAVEANDVSAALSFVATSATPAIRNEIERQMPQVKIERARVIGTPKIEVGADPERRPRSSAAA